MPTKLTRFICGELANVFVTTLFAWTLMLAIVLGMHEGIRNGLTVGVMVRLIPLISLNAICFALPGTVLFGVCTVYGRMSSMNEIIAIKSLGISPWVLIRPAILFAVAASLLTVLVIEFAFSWGYHEVHRIVAKSAAEIAYSVLSAQRKYATNQFAVRVECVDGRRLMRPTIVFRDGDRSTTITAREALLDANSHDGMLTLALTDGVVSIGKQTTLRFPGTIQHSFALGDDPPEMANPSHMRLHEVAIAREKQRARIEQQEELLASAAALKLMIGDFVGLKGPGLAARSDQLLHIQRHLHRLETEPYRRWASGFSCLSFAVIGIPLAIRLRSSDFMTTFGISFLPILLVYYPLFALSLDRAKVGVWPPYTVWLGNVVCLIVGIGLFRSVLRH